MPGIKRMDDAGLYAAFKAKDTRFDGRFYVGVSSTGIYCRPVCRARMPKAANCAFFPTAAEAERAGYRPCLLCRPELAPGGSVMDATAVLAGKAARMLDAQCDAQESLETLAERLGCTGRHLRRVFAAAYHVSPVAYLQTRRLLLAKNLLTDTRLSVLDVAMAAGFGSVRRLNHLFQKHYRLTPTALRKRAPDDGGRGGDIALLLGYRPPYRYDAMLNFLAGRAIAGIEKVEGGCYLRAVRLKREDAASIDGWIRVGHAPEKNALRLTLSHSLLPVLPQVLARVRHLFDVDADPEAMDETLASMNGIRDGLYVKGTRLPGCFDAFEMAVRAVLGQQITVKAAGTLAGRLVSALGLPVSTGIAGLTHVFPSPEDMPALDAPIEARLGPLGVVSARARTIGALAEALAHGAVDFSLCAHPEAEMAKLLAIPGIGRWTAQYIAMRAMAWPDAFLETDAGIKKALAPLTPKEMLALAEAWHPWRSYATINLWNALS